MKRAGYDMDAGAKRLQDLLDKQKKEREEREMNSTKSEEASPMIKPPKNEFGKKEDAFAHAKKHGGKVMKKTFTHPTSGMQTVSYVVREDAEIDEAIKKPNATTRHLRDYPVSDKDVAKPVKKPEKKKPEQGVAEAAFKDPSPMMKDSIKQDRIRSLNNLIAIAKVKGVHHKVKEYESELKKLKETTEVTEAGPFSYGAKPPRKGSVAYNALMKRKEQDKNRVKEIEAIGTKNHHVGVAKVTKEEIEDVTEANDDMYKYIDQSGGQVIKGNSGTYVGYTHSATKGKGANILKHHNTKKYYAAGGSSTAFTQKTTLHDTPQAAAKAYHKGNLAEELNYGKSFKDLREAAFYSNCCPDEEYGFTEEQFTVTGNEQYEDWGDDIVEGKLSFSKLSQRLQEEDGKNVKLNKPFLTPGGPKKRAVYVKNDKGNTVKVNFGDPNLEIKRDDPERKSSFRARHNCDNPGPKWKARYWSCKFWSSTPVSKL